MILGNHLIACDTVFELQGSMLDMLRGYLSKSPMNRLGLRYVAALYAAEFVPGIKESVQARGTMR